MSALPRTDEEMVERVIDPPKPEVEDRALVPPRARAPRVRHGKMDRGIAEEICERVADGEDFVALFQGPGMPHHRTFRRWRKEDPKLDKLYQDAIAESAEMLLLGKHMEVILTETDARLLQARTQALQFQIERRNPKRFGKQNDGAGMGAAPVLNVMVNGKAMISYSAGKAVVPDD